jgi:ankyrin repeat protein
MSIEFQLCELIAQGCISLHEIENFLEEGVDLNQLFEDHVTILGSAIAMERLDIVRLLVNSGANIQRRILPPVIFSGGEIYDGEVVDAPIILAAHIANQDIFDFLSPMSDSQSRRDATGILPFGFLERFELENWDMDYRKYPEFINLQSTHEFLRLQRDVNEILDSGCSKLWNLAHNGAIESVVKLVESGANVNLPNQTDGWTPLIIAASTHEIWSFGTQCAWGESWSNQLKIVEYLLKWGADINVKSNQGKTPLMEVISSGITCHHSLVFSSVDCWLQSQDKLREIVCLLIQAGVDLNVVSNTGKTALMEAVLIGRSDITKILLNTGSDINIIDNDGNTAAQLAESLGYDKIARQIQGS